MTPDWAAKAVAVPWANLATAVAESVQLYFQNTPTTLGDPDGHEHKESPGKGEEYTGPKACRSDQTLECNSLRLTGCHLYDDL